MYIYPKSTLQKGNSGPLKFTYLVPQDSRHGPLWRPLPGVCTPTQGYRVHLWCGGIRWMDL